MIDVEDVVVADDAQLVEHVAREVRAAVVERGQQAEDPQVPVELEADRVDDLDEVVQALHRVELRLDRDDHAVGGDEPVDRQQAEVRRAVDQHVVVLDDRLAHRLAQDRLAAERREQLALGAGEVDVRRRDVDARGLGRQDDLVHRRAAVREDVGHRLARSVLRLMPTPAVRFACGSMSTSRTLKPSSASAPARLIAVVVLPTPPFWLAIAITCVKGVTSGFAGRDGRPAGRREWANATPRPDRAPVEVVHTMTELCTVLWISAARGPRIDGCRADR